MVCMRRDRKFVEARERKRNRTGQMRNRGERMQIRGSRLDHMAKHDVKACKHVHMPLPLPTRPMSCCTDQDRGPFRYTTAVVMRAPRPGTVFTPPHLAVMLLLGTNFRCSIHSRNTIGDRRLVESESLSFLMQPFSSWRDPMCSSFHSPHLRSTCKLLELLHKVLVELDNAPGPISAGCKESRPEMQSALLLSKAGSSDNANAGRIQHAEAVELVWSTTLLLGLLNGLLWKMDSGEEIHGTLEHAYVSILSTVYYGGKKNIGIARLH